MAAFTRETLFVERGIEGLGLPDSVVAPSVVRFDNATKLLSYLERMPWHEAKRVLMLAKRSGGFVKDFPGGQGTCEPGWHYFIPAIGCPADCRYCFLQTYHPSGAPVVFANAADLLAELEEKLQRSPQGYYYGGELCDNLLLEGYLKIIERLVALFGRFPAATLELRTKGAAVDSLVCAGGAENIIVSWTFSPRKVVEEFEKGTAGFDERIGAAADVQQAGYRVGVRFDPIILRGRWREGYRELVESLRVHLDASRVESVHMGCLRYSPALKAAVMSRFGSSAPFDGEFVRCADGKLRYPRPLRVAAYREIAKMVRDWSREIHLRLFMETGAAEAGFSGDA